jgi:RNA polymerase sigma factor (sigma-70 family)
MTQSSDITLGDLAKHPDSISHVVTDHYQAMMHYAVRGYALDEAEAESLVQQVFLELWQEMHKGIRKEAVPVNKWLFTRLRQRALNYVERDRNRYTAVGGGADNLLETQIIPFSTAVEMIQREMLECLRAGVAQCLRGRTQEVIQRYMDGLAPTQIARELNISAARVSQLLHKGVWLLKGWLQDHGFSERG